MECLTIKELVLATNGKLIYGDYNDCVSDIVIDSRAANAQNAFVAIVGENLDGHTFMKSAYKFNRGKRYIFGSRRYFKIL